MKKYFFLSITILSILVGCSSIDQRAIQMVKDSKCAYGGSTWGSLLSNAASVSGTIKYEVMPHKEREDMRVVYAIINRTSEKTNRPLEIVVFFDVNLNTEQTENYGIVINGQNVSVIDFVWGNY